MRFCDEHQLRKIVAALMIDQRRRQARAENKPHRRPHEPIPLIDPRHVPTWTRCSTPPTRSSRTGGCNDVEDGDVLIACGLLYELSDAVDALRANLDGGELLSPCA